MTNKTQETLDLVKGALANPSADIAKGFTQSTDPTSGLTGYDLSAPAKVLYPVLTPLRNEIPRVGGGFGIQANWRAITGININKQSIGVGQGNRGGVIATALKDFFASYVSMGLEDFVTFEAQNAGVGFQDVNATAAEGLLRALMIGEENVLLGGNSTRGLGVTPTPSLFALGAAGSLQPGVLSVIAVALTLDGLQSASVANGVRGVQTRTNTDGSTDTYGGGSAQKSPAATVNLAADSTSVSAGIDAVPGAAGYAWYWGAAGQEKLGAITTVNSFVITDSAAGTQAASELTVDASQNGLVHDGLLAIAAAPGSGAYIKSLDGNQLTADGEGGVAEIDAALESFWVNYKLSPDCIWVSAQEQKTIGRAVFGSSGAARFNFAATQDGIVGGTMVRSYLNKFSMAGAKEIPVKLHPNLPAGTILFTTNALPYPLSNVSNVMQVRTRQDYHAITWPLRSRKLEMGVYTDQVLQHFFTPSLGVISNIGK